MQIDYINQGFGGIKLYHSASLSPSEIPRITIPTITEITHAYCDALSFSLRKTLDSTTETMQYDATMGAESTGFLAIA